MQFLESSKFFTWVILSQEQAARALIKSVSYSKSRTSGDVNQWSSDESPVCDKSDRSDPGFIWEEEKTPSLSGGWKIHDNLKSDCPIITQRRKAWTLFLLSVSDSAADSRWASILHHDKNINHTDSINFCGRSNLFSRTPVMSFPEVSQVLCVCFRFAAKFNLVDKLFTNNCRWSKINGCHVLPNESMHAGKDLPCRGKHTEINYWCRSVSECGAGYYWTVWEIIVHTQKTSCRLKP